jgi:putative endonuclease
LDQIWFFYIVECRDNSYYSGITNNLDQRLKAHNQGSGAKYTRGRGPVTLVYSEKKNCLSDALKREALVKHWSRTQKQQLFTRGSVLSNELDASFPVTGGS